MDKDEIWNKTLVLLLEDTDEEDPKTVFLNLLTPVGVFGDQFVLLAESTPVESWVRKNYLTEIQDKLLQVMGTPVSVGLGVSTQKEAPQQTTPAPVETVQQPEPDWMNQFVDPASLSGHSPSPNMAAAEEAERVGGEYASSPTSGDEALFSKCTFDTFVVGKSNEFARGAALAVAELPGTAYNPLFIYGNSGLGKTHLLVAIANYAMQNFPRMATRYVSANKFLNDYVEATQRNQWGTFNSKYHQVDILLVDDVQYLEGKDETINQLFNIFNEMTNRNKQIVLSADRAPKDIDMDDRMRTSNHRITKRAWQSSRITSRASTNIRASTVTSPTRSSSTSPMSPHQTSGRWKGQSRDS